jgi:general stress protein 26
MRPYRKEMEMENLKDKIYEIIKQPQLMPLATVAAEGKPWVRYIMGVTSPDLTVRFVTSLHSRKVAQIKGSAEVHLAGRGLSPDLESPYVQIAGLAEISTEEQERNGMWSDYLKAYFSGPDDPTYCVVIVKPYRIEYMGGSIAPEVWEA